MADIRNFTPWVDTAQGRQFAYHDSSGVMVFPWQTVPTPKPVVQRRTVGTWDPFTGWTVPKPKPVVQRVVAIQPEKKQISSPVPIYGTSFGSGPVTEQAPPRPLPRPLPKIVAPPVFKKSFGPSPVTEQAPPRPSPKPPPKAVPPPVFKPSRVPPPSPPPGPAAVAPAAGGAGLLLLIGLALIGMRRK